MNYKIISVSQDDNLVRIRIYEDGQEPTDGMGLDFPVPVPLTDESLVTASEARIFQYLQELPPTVEDSPVTIVGIPQTYEP